MELTALARTVLIERLVEQENAAAHLHVLACVAEATAYLARQEADAAQRVLSEVKVWLALLPDDTALELRAPKRDADPAKRLGVRPRPVPRSDEASLKLGNFPEFEIRKLCGFEIPKLRGFETASPCPAFRARGETAAASPCCRAFR